MATATKPSEQPAATKSDAGTEAAAGAEQRLLRARETLPAEELAIVKQVRAFMETKVAPDHHASTGSTTRFPSSCCRR